MTMPCERSRAVLQTRKFLIEISHDKTLPNRVRSDAKHLLRHFPTVDDMILAGRIEEYRELLSSDLVEPVFSSMIDG